MATFNSQSVTSIIHSWENIVLRAVGGSIVSNIKLYTNIWMMRLITVHSRVSIGIAYINGHSVNMCQHADLRCT
jgi:hypothetical protein